MREPREDCEAEFLEEMVGKVRFSHDSDGDFGKGGPRGSIVFSPSELP